MSGKSRTIKIAPVSRVEGHGAIIIKLDAKGEVLPWGIMVEILGTERMEIPIDGIDEEALARCLGPWVEKGNELISRTKEHIGDMIGRLEMGI